MSDRARRPTLTRRQQRIGSPEGNGVRVVETAGVRAEDDIPRRADDAGCGGNQRLSVHFENQTVAICIHETIVIIIRVASVSDPVEIGVALIGAGVTAYLLGILLNVQQQNAERWRTEIRSRIREPVNRGES